MGALLTNIRILFSIALIIIIHTVSAQEEIRLVAGNGRGDGISSGRLEVRRNNGTSPWGTVAVYSSYFKDKQAQLVCNVLGYKYGEAKINAYYGRGTLNVLVYSLYCGTVTKFFDCTFSWSSGTGYNYLHYRDVGVNCFNKTAKIVNDGQMQSYGNHDAGVVVLWNNGWRLICDDGWNDEAAAVVCRDAGFVDGHALCCSQLSPFRYNPSFTSSYPYKYYRNFNCSGNVDDLLDCGYSVSSYPSCRTGHLASVICRNTTLSNVNNTFDIRLVNTTGSSGAVEVKRYGYWALVNGDSSSGWNEAAANVSCRQMGFTGGIAYYKDRNSHSKRNFWVQNLNCNGSENSLDECVTNWGSLASYEANVVCYRENIKLSLVNGSRSYGRVQLSVDGVPGTICNRGMYGSSMASVVCQELGFGQGTDLISGYFGAGDGPVYLESVYCNSDSIWDCRYNVGWESHSSLCETHSYDLTVKCHGKVKIDNGDHSNGIVYEQKTSSNSWKVICGDLFTVNAAKVLCREIGFTNGKVLPSGTFGAASGYYSSLVFNCNGNETDLSQCTTSSTSCGGFLKKYAAVHCFDGTLDTERKLELKGSPGHPNTGLVSVSLNGFTGGICSDFFTQEAVKVVCRQLGYTNGLLYRYPTIVNKYAIQELQCVGNETSIFDCPMGSTSCLANAYQSGVFCYNNTAPVLRFMDSASGKLEIVDGLDVGGVCLSSNVVSYQSSSQAKVLCRQMNFKSGEFSPGSPVYTVPIFMNYVRCEGHESSIFECLNDGWRVNEESQCSSSSKSLSCYNSVRIKRALGVSYSSGYVEMLDRYWNPVCPGLNDNAARVICRELGAPYYKVLSDNLFKSGRNTHGMKINNCFGNETSIMNCTYTKEYCYGTSSLFCSKRSNLDYFDIHPSTIGAEGQFYSKIEITMYGISGTICSEGWTDTAAKVFCKSQGYLFGVSLGALRSTTTRNLATDFRCTGVETRLQDCRYSTANLTACQSEMMMANALCSNETGGLSIRLAPSNKSRNVGQVQVGYHGQWGHVCKSRFRYDQNLAAIACRQLGYLDGEDNSPRYYSSDQPPILEIYGISDCGNETEIWKCKLLKFNTTDTCSYGTALYVKCSTSVRLTPGHNVGVVSFLGYGRRGPICRDGFDEKAAKVACGQLGYTYHYLLDYQPFTSPDLTGLVYVYNNFRCGGNENSLNRCRYDTRYCRSKKAVQLMCTNYPPHSGYTLNIKLSSYGQVTVNHFDTNGGICSDNWTDNDAKVVCREVLGNEYTGGFSYKRIKSESEGTQLGIKWFTNLNCTGNESAISQCHHSPWGDINNCSSDTQAAVYCLSNSASRLGIRLEGGDDRSGKLGVSAAGVWGSVCGKDFTDREASVACRMLNFKGGHVVVNRLIGYSGRIHITQMNCSGDETSILDCGLKLSETRSGCSHSVDVAVRCYNYVRMTGSTINYINYGKLEILIDGWKPVCDTEFTDLMAEKACKDMGYETGSYVCCSSLGESDNRSMVSLSRCRETSGSLSETCYVTTGCSSGKYVTVYCSKTAFSNSDIATMAVEENRVMVTVAGMQSAICARNWTDKEANVSCKHAGHQGGIARFTFNKNPNPVLFGNIKCRGMETNLTQCSRTQHSTGCSEAFTNQQAIAGAICYNTNAPRLFLQYGYPKYQLNENQYSVCLDNPGMKVFCRQLGYLNNYMSSYDYSYVQSKNRIQCKGDEASIFHCVTKKQSNRCKQYKIDCFNHVRIINKENSPPGELLVHVDDKTGHVCSDGWTHTNTLVVCRELGYSNGYSMVDNKEWYNLAIMDRVNCTGQESSVIECSHSKPYLPVCHNQVRVKCLNRNMVTGFTLGTQYSGTNHMGSVSVYYEGLRGFICPDNWDDVDATVACKKFGFTKGKAVRLKSSVRRPYLLSNVNCSGTEYRMDLCELDIGDVTHCSSNNVAGIICSSQTGIFSGLLGDNGIGLVQISIDGTWGVFCNSIGNAESYNVFCKSMGYTSGHYVSNVENQGYNITGPVYNTVFSCSGLETDITECPHSAWNRNYRCSRYVSVHCLSDVRLHEDGQHSTTPPRSGPVEIYYQDQWYLVCDDGFNDAEAEIVCFDLGFTDGKAIHGSTFGWGYDPRLEVSNMSLSCNGSETSASGCLTISSCRSGQYASVVCFNETDIDDEYLESDYVFSLERQSTTVNSSGTVGVSIFGVQGKICADDWDDEDAAVYCRSQGYSVGIAYKDHPKFDKQLPFWLGKFECDGTESDLNQCIHKNRLTMEKCESTSGAAVVCHDGNFDTSFRFYNKTSSFYNGITGRLYLTIDGVEGDLCKDLMDSNDANVFCRQSGYDRGWETTYRRTSDTLSWKIDFKCSGNETNLLDCSHSGFHQTDIGRPCEATYLYCFNSVYLTGTGSVRIYDGITDKWTGVCNDIFGEVEANVVCKSLSSMSIGGIPILGSLPSDNSDDLANHTRRCNGTEALYTDCPIVSSDCKSGRYASVKCFNTRPDTTNFTLSLLPENRSKFAGLLNVILPSGAVGPICSKGFGKKEATVACKQLGYIGGVPYLTYKYYIKKSMVMADVSCSGEEYSLADCQYNTTSSKYRCGYFSNRAGVLCYNTSSGVNYRLTGGDRPGEGYVQMQYEGEWGNICASRYGYSKNAMSKVLCREVGYTDGIAMFDQRTVVSDTSKEWFSQLECTGDETTPTNCGSYGFNDSYSCRFTLLLKCYNQSLEISDLRLVGGENYGRVEVFMQGPNEWGTVCDRYFSDVDASVICRQLDYSTGKAVRSGGLGIGQGPIWLTDVGCIGTESNITECEHTSYTLPVCSHAKDVGVICSGKKSTVPTTHTTSAIATTTIAVPITNTTTPITSNTTTYVSNLTTPTTSIPTTPTTSNPATLTTSSLTTPTSSIPTTYETSNPTTSSPTTPTTSSPTTPTTSSPTTPTTPIPTTPTTSSPTTPTTPIPTTPTTSSPTTPTTSSPTTPTTPIPTTPTTSSPTMPTTSIPTTPIPTTPTTSITTTPITSSPTTPTTPIPTTPTTPIPTTPTTPISTTYETSPTTPTTTNEKTTTVTTPITSSSAPISTKQATTSSTTDPKKVTGKSTFFPGDPEKSTVAEKGNTDTQSLLSDKEVTITIGSVLGGAIVILIVIVIVIKMKKRQGGYMLSDDLSESTKMSEF